MGPPTSCYQLVDSYNSSLILIKTLIGQNNLKKLSEKSQNGDI